LTGTLGDDRRQEVAERLDSILREVWPGHPSDAADPDVNLISAGVTSAQLVTFLVRVEDSFALEWDEKKLPAGALSSLGAIAKVVLESSAKPSIGETFQ